MDGTHRHRNLPSRWGNDCWIKNHGFFFPPTPPDWIGPSDSIFWSFTLTNITDISSRVPDQMITFYIHFFSDFWRFADISVKWNAVMWKLMGCLVVALVCTQGAGHVTSCPLLHGDGAREMLAEGLLELWNHGPQETPREKQSLISLEPDWLDIIGVSTCISGKILNLSSLLRGAAFVFGMSVQGWHMTAASVLIQTAQNCVPWEARQVQPMSLQLEDIRNLQRRETCCK